MGGHTIESGDLMEGRVVLFHVSGFGFEELQDVSTPGHSIRKGDQLPAKDNNDQKVGSVPTTTIEEGYQQTSSR